MAASSCVMSKQQKWFSWGANSYGQLGQGHQHDLSLPQCISEIPKDVTYVCGGGGHTLFQTAQGKCYACGWNNKGQLGLGTDGKEDTIHKPINQQYVNEDILKVAAGWDHSMIITKNGSLLTFGSNVFGQLGSGNKAVCSSTPELVNTPEEPKQDLACGMRHSIVLAGNNIYTCGIGKKGQLGQFSPDGMPINKIDHFEKVIFPKGCGKVIQVAAGANHSAAVTDTGQLVVWGDNKHGQLAMNPAVTPVQHTPVIVPASLFENRRIVEIHSGWTHMLALTDTGYIYAWGRSDYGQLGVGKSRQEMVGFCQWQPHLLAINNPKKIVCGAEHNLLISGNDELFTWGWNEHGMCGTGDNLDICDPQKVNFFDNQKVISIGCGSGHSFAQIENL